MGGPLILISTTPLCLGGILRVDLTVPIVAFWVLACGKVKNFPFRCIKHCMSLSQAYDNENFFCILMLKISSVLGNWSQIIKLCVNLKSAICRCNDVDPKVVMGEPSAVFNLAALGCMGVL